MVLSLIVHHINHSLHYWPTEGEGWEVLNDRFSPNHVIMLPNGSAVGLIPINVVNITHPLWHHLRYEEKKKTLNLGQITKIQTRTWRNCQFWWQKEILEERIEENLQGKKKQYFKKYSGNVWYKSILALDSIKSPFLYFFWKNALYCMKQLN